MDGFLVQRFVRDARERAAGAAVRRVEPVVDGMLLALEGKRPEVELGLHATSGAAWATLLSRDARARLHAELQVALPDLVTPEPALEWRPDAATPLDALRAWLVRPAAGHPGFDRLLSARLVDLEPRGGDRALRLEFEVADALGRTERLALVAELFDRAANFVLCGADGSELANWRGRPVTSVRDPVTSLPAEVPLAWDPERGVHGEPQSPTPGLSLQAAAHLALADRAADELARRRARDLRRVESRLARLVEKLDAEAAGAAEAERWKQQGELLAANLHRVRRGQARITVEDFFAGGTRREIELDPTVSAQENLARLFKRARRAARAQATIEPRRDATRAELDSVRQALAADSHRRMWHLVLPAAAAEWRDACPEATRTPLPALWAPGGPGWRAAGQDAAESRTTAAGPGRRFVLAGDWEIRVGRSNEENDELTHRFARPEDVWLHASGVPGSHVILKMQGRSDNPPRDVLEAAAAIAARFSKGKHAGTVPVVWTRKRYVRKPRGAKPGLAVCTHEKTIFVRPGLPGDSEE